jgi:hypothetical protein
MAIAACCLAVGQSWQTANAQEPPAPSITNSAMPDSAPALPPNVYPSSPLAQVIRLAQADVSEDVIMMYVTNSGSTFNLDSDKIIFLKDIGMPDDLVTAMMQRDRELHQQMSAYQPPQLAPEPAPQAPPIASEPVTTELPPEQPTEVTVNNFYSTLAPYGSWVDVSGYGRCWRPSVISYNSAWQPYCDHGHWIYTDCGWYWSSDYSWGWAAFHYGRWFNHPRYGWCWNPGTVWGPSWVTWRYANNYCGWAPLPPFTACAAGVGITYHGVSVTADFNFGLAANCFTFVPIKNFCDPHPRRYCVPPAQVTQVFNQTTVINNINVNDHNQTIVNNGIEPQKIMSVTQTQIHPLAIRDSATPVARGEQVGRDGRTLFVNRTRFTRNPTASNNKIGSPYTAPAQPSQNPVVGSPYAPQNNFAHNNHSGNNNDPANNNYSINNNSVADNNPPANNNFSRNNNSQPQRHSQSTPQPQGDWQHAYTYGAPAQNNPTMLNPTAVNHSAPATSVQPAAPSTLNDSTDVRWYPTPRMRQFEQQSSRGNSGSASSGSVSTSGASEPQSQHASGGVRHEGRYSGQSGNAGATPAAQNSTEQQTQHVSGGAKNQWRYSSQSGNASSQTASAQSSSQPMPVSPTTPTTPTIQPGRGWGKIQNSQQ